MEQKSNTSSRSPKGQGPTSEASVKGNTASRWSDARRQAARQLHDDICQRLTSLALDLQSIAGVLSNTGEPSAKLEQITCQIADLSDEVSTISRDLYPTIVEDFGLEAALAALTANFCREGNQKATFSARKVPEKVPPNIAFTLYSVTQDALRRARDHKVPFSTKISLLGTEQDLRLQISYQCGSSCQNSSLRFIKAQVEDWIRLVRGSITVRCVSKGVRTTVHVPLCLSPASNR
jgi:signal transduction histidine kinase